MKMTTSDDNNDNIIRHSSNKYIMGVDVGTTSIRCIIYDHDTKIIARSAKPTHLIYPHVGWCEIDPNHLWQLFCNVVNSAVKNANISFSDVECMGICTLRNTFITWNKLTGKPYHNFITWKDLRSTQLCNEWNSSMRMNGYRTAAKLMYYVTRNRKHLIDSNMHIAPGQVTMNLVWQLKNCTELQEGIRSGEALFGTVDSYLIWKLTSGRHHVTEPTNSSVTAMLDLATLDWNYTLHQMLGIPEAILPKVVANDFEFGLTDPKVFGSPIKISSLMGDQQAALFGECCFEPGYIKCTMGTGTFLDLNIGDQLMPGHNGVYPIVAWLTKDGKQNYALECDSNDTGSTILWGRQVELFTAPEETAAIANSLPDNSGLYFIPAFSGIQTPINDSRAVASFIGLKPFTEKPHMVRSLLEAIVFRVMQMFEAITKDFMFEIKTLRVDGGVSNNDFILQNIANITGKTVERGNHNEMSTLGAVFMAGLSSKYWPSVDHVKSLRSCSNTFTMNQMDSEAIKKQYDRWLSAMSRCLDWYDEY